MHLTLADAGDKIEDANFDEQNAEAQLLHLYTFIEWESNDEKYENKSMNYFDRVFESEINRAIKLTEEAYENMLYKNNYRELCSRIEQMNISLIKNFIESQTLLLAPICSHICDYVYQLLYLNKSIMEAKWLISDKIDQSLIDSRNYLFKYYQHLTFNEYEILIHNQQYIQRSLKLNQLQIKLIDDEHTGNINNIDDIIPGYHINKFDHFIY
ncbi:unnamed protein product [Rotaria sordida]|uniref:Methionyl/Valyl/Leucyl/Isoleucyl-tRNA synthetase anticodon-binding domain-containing protein n=2 Tax=Rotaria sordida TaxID=392033 RepID=A0A814WVM6_9BILA|nr:unnamed protein product [Rotaria sordida]